MTRTKVVLTVAWQWKCPGCGHRNFTGGFGVEMSLEARERLLSVMQSDDIEGLRAIPANVRCSSCKERYAAR